MILSLLWVLLISSTRGDNYVNAEHLTTDKEEGVSPFMDIHNVVISVHFENRWNCTDELCYWSGNNSGWMQVWSVTPLWSLAVLYVALCSTGSRWPRPWHSMHHGVSVCKQFAVKYTDWQNVLLQLNTCWFAVINIHSVWPLYSYTAAQHILSLCITMLIWHWSSCTDVCLSDTVQRLIYLTAPGPKSFICKWHVILMWQQSVTML